MVLCMEELTVHAQCHDLLSASNSQTHFMTPLKNKHETMCAEVHPSEKKLIETKRCLGGWDGEMKKREREKESDTQRTFSGQPWHAPSSPVAGEHDIPV